MDSRYDRKVTGKSGLTRSGGLIWLIVAVAISLLWVEPVNLWWTAMAGWVIVVIGWIGRKLLRRELSGGDAAGSWLTLAVLVFLAWACGEAIVYLRPRLFGFNPVALFDATLEPSVEGTAWVGALELGLLVACIGGAWLLSSVVAAASANAGWRFDKIMARSFGQLKRSRMAGSYAALAGIVTVAAAMITEQSGMPWRIVMGLAAAYTQICWLALADRSQVSADRQQEVDHSQVSADRSQTIDQLQMLANSPQCASARPASERGAFVSRTIRRVVAIALVALHVILFGFYFYLKGLNDWNPSHPDWLPLGWGVGVVFTLIAWVFSLSRITYVVWMLVIGLICALLLGMIAGSYDWEMLT